MPINKTKHIKMTERWGKFEQFTQNEKTTVHILYIDAQQSLSKNVHKNIDKLWIILDKNLQVEIDKEIFEPESGESFEIKRGQSHTLSNIGYEHDTPARVLEISFFDFSEDSYMLKNLYKQ